MDGQPATAAACSKPGALTGTGLGLRGTHIDQVLTEKPDVAWFEILADNHTASGGVVPRQLAAVRSNYPFVFHCVGMSLGGTAPLDIDYLKRIKQMIRQYEPAHVSDHLCFSNHTGHHYHDLLPIPYTSEALSHVVDRVKQVQDILETRLLVENVSSYLGYQDSMLTEAEFLRALAIEADCDLLLDVNNAYVNDINHGIDASAFIQSLPVERIREVHLAGFEDKGEYLIDAHNNPVAGAVWSLFAEVIRRCPAVPALIEWDNDIPSLEVLRAEALQAESVRHAVMTDEQTADDTALIPRPGQILAATAP
jgi:uncharacterized protein